MAYRAMVGRKKIIADYETLCVDESKSGVVAKEVSGGGVGRAVVVGAELRCHVTMG